MATTILWIGLLLISIITVIVISVVMYKNHNKTTEGFNEGSGAPINTDNITTIQSVMPVDQLTDTFLTPTKLTEALPNAIPNGLICMWSGTIPPKNWVLCNGKNGTPRLTGKFVLAGTDELVNTVGGQVPNYLKDDMTVSLTTNNLPEHDHKITGFRSYENEPGKKAIGIRDAKSGSGTWIHQISALYHGVVAEYPVPKDRNDPTKKNVTNEAPIILPKLPYYVLAYIMYTGGKKE